MICFLELGSYLGKANNSCLDEIVKLNNGSSRVFTTADGGRLKWKNKPKLQVLDTLPHPSLLRTHCLLQCVSADSGLPLATYDHKLFAGIRNKNSTLDISPSAAHLTDILVGKRMHLIIWGTN